MRVARSRSLTDPSRLALALLGIMIVLLIAGLLGMHALSGSSSHAAVGDHDRPNLTSQAITAVDGADPGAAMHCDVGCVAPAPGHAPDAPGHEGVTACVLALLAGLFLLVPPTVGVPGLLSVPSLLSLADRLGALVPRAGPDLIVLSISRT